jgi:hypothetical protein
LNAWRLHGLGNRLLGIPKTHDRHVRSAPIFGCNDVSPQSGAWCLVYLAIR